MKPRQAESSNRVIYAALIGNVLVAVAKFVAAGFSGSGAMLTEAVHSSTDSINQVLLLIGGRRSAAPPDKSHPFGYGLEIYFWTFVVAVMVLIAGGAVSVAEGLHKLASHEPAKSPVINLAVLGVSTLFEAGSFTVGYREYRSTVRGRRVDGKHIGFWKFIEISKNPSLYESLLEDVAALIGLAIAAVGVIAGAWFHVRWADGAASIAIGALLIVTALIIVRATQGLIAGEAAAEPVLDDIAFALAGERTPIPPADIRTLQLGPNEILVTLPAALILGDLAAEPEAWARDIARRVRSVDHRISHVLFAFDDGGRGPAEAPKHPPV